MSVTKILSRGSGFEPLSSAWIADALTVWTNLA